MQAAIRSTSILAVLLCCGSSRAADADAVERGRKALLEKSYVPPLWGPDAYANAWRNWGPKASAPPADYDRRFRRIERRTARFEHSPTGKCRRLATLEPGGKTIVSDRPGTAVHDDGGSEFLAHKFEIRISKFETISKFRIRKIVF